MLRFFFCFVGGDGSNTSVGVAGVAAAGVCDVVGDAGPAGVGDS